jgi:hypothetical protein
MCLLNYGLLSKSPSYLTVLSWTVIIPLHHEKKDPLVRWKIDQIPELVPQKERFRAKAPCRELQEET